jgi:carbamoyl-phosphate synthase large subunit
MIERRQVDWIVNTPSSGTDPRVDEITMRAHAVTRAIPITTTLDGLRAALDGLDAGGDGAVDVCSLQEYHRHAPEIDASGTRDHNGQV